MSWMHWGYFVSMLSIPQGTAVLFPLCVHVSGTALCFHQDPPSLKTARTGQSIKHASGNILHFKKFLIINNQGEFLLI